VSHEHEVHGNGGGMTISCEEYEAYVEAELGRLREELRELKERWELHLALSEPPQEDE
jgi:hypothetical protein